MRLPALALFERSLREESRRFRAYGLRLLLLVITLFAVMLAQQTSRFFGAPGLRLFTSLMYINFFYICVIGLELFASAVAEEKEERTLGLLRMTSLSPVAILLGKSTSRAISMVLLLVSQFPFTILAVTLGGVSLRQVVAAYIVLLAYIVFLSNLALLTSVMCRRTGTAAGLAGLVLLFYFLGPWMMKGVVELLHEDGLLPGLIELGRPGVDWVLDRVIATSPFARMRVVLRTGFAESVFGLQTISNVVLGAVCFGLAWVVFDFFTREQRDVSPRRAGVAKGSSRLRAFAAGRSWKLAIVWKDFYFHSGGLLVMIVKTLVLGVAVAIPAWLMYRHGNSGNYTRELGGVTMVVGLVALGIEAAFHASHLFDDERKWQTLSSLYGLPMSLGQITRQKVMGCMLAMVPSAAVFCVGVLLAPEEFFEGLGEMLTEIGGWYGMAQYTLFVYTTVFLSLYVKRGALALALVMIYVGNMMLIMPLGLFGLMGGGPEGVFLCMTFVIVCGCIFLHYRIGQRVRTLAAE